MLVVCRTFVRQGDAVTTHETCETSPNPTKSKKLYKTIGALSLLAQDPPPRQLRAEIASKWFRELRTKQYLLYQWYLPLLAKAGNWKIRPPDDVTAVFEAAKASRLFTKIVVLTHRKRHESLMVGVIVRGGFEHYFKIAHWSEHRLTSLIHIRMLRFITERGASNSSQRHLLAREAFPYVGSLSIVEIVVWTLASWHISSWRFNTTMATLVILPIAAVVLKTTRKENVARKSLWVLPCNALALFLLGVMSQQPQPLYLHQQPRHALSSIKDQTPTVLAQICSHHPNRVLHEWVIVTSLGPMLLGQGNYDGVLRVKPNRKLARRLDYSLVWLTYHKADRIGSLPTITSVRTIRKQEVCGK